ncbi:MULTISPECIES: fructosamine kinase family protein [Prochlorococcus]|uniref:fructosamine kinase family protein n=1 Tax=Prochlorococcus TaxID=1218 RepID=UPI0005338B97|nr:MULTISPECIES: fructosamine kinase family protein [Prochlorococcus]KGG13590.1 Ribulosamine/erythrulosamine 3-kinase potentially involved in protein deglycation [Prochlorococcus sp. MIT 0601]
METFLIEQINGSNGPLAGSTIKNTTSIKGGCVHDAWCLELNDGEKVFAKTSSLKNFQMLKVESDGLKALNEYANKNVLYIPKPLMVQKLETHSILLMPWIKFARGDELKLGEGLALLHKTSATKGQEFFGWSEDGFIGLGSQLKGWKKQWGECFTDLRLKPQIQIAQKWGLDINLNKLDKFLSQIRSLLDEHEPSPSLVHGDLWKGNAGIDEKGCGIIFDPAVWWADREVDIAMTLLFGGFSKNFYAGYQKIWPLEEKWETRVDIYNFYHLLNHANIFGGSYKSQCYEAIKKIYKVLNTE